MVSLTPDMYSKLLRLAYFAEREAASWPYQAQPPFGPVLSWLETEIPAQIRQEDIKHAA
jgi:hypothetical protein